MPSFGELALYAAPPTPPRDADRDTDKALDEVILSLDSFPSIQDAQASFNTPPNSSPSYKCSVATSLSSRKRKRARFQPDSSLCDEIPSAPPSTQDALPPSTQLSKPTRSILKPFQLSSTPPTPHRFESFAAMLESLVKMLASPAVSARVDAYNTLHNSLRAYKEIPDAESFSQKLPLFEHFMQRDIGAVSDLTGKTDTRLALPALKLAILLFADKSLVSQDLSLDFLDWLADDTLRVLKTPGVSKELAKNQLHLLTLETFCAKTLTPHRAAEVVAGLHTVHERVSGSVMNSVRNGIYAQLLHQHKAVMLQRLSDWLPIVLRAMWSNVYEIQRRAVDLGLKAAESLGTSRLATAVFNKYCNAKLLDAGGMTCFDLFEDNVTAILRNGSPEARLELPRIWSTVVLFLRGSQQPLLQWPFLGRWLDLIFECFNSKDPRLVSRSFSAWNRFLYALKPDHQTKLPTMTLLVKPIIAELTRTPRSPLATQSRSAAWSTYQLLLFYAFRPGIPDAQIAVFWRGLVEDVLGSMLPLDESDFVQLYELLANLLHESALRVWNDEQIPANFKTPIQRRQIPRLDARGVRKNLSTVLPLIERLLKSDIPEDLVDTVSQLQVQTWQSLMASVAEAGSKEVTASSEARKATADILGTFDSLQWVNDGCLPARDKQASRAYLTWQMLDSTITTLGAHAVLYAKTSVAHPVSSPPALASEWSRSIVPRSFNFYLSSARGTNLEAVDWKPQAVIRQCLSAISSTSSALSFLAAIAQSTVYVKGEVRRDTAEYSVLAEVISNTLSIVRGQSKKLQADNTSLTQYREITAIWKIAMMSQNSELWPLLSDQMSLMMAAIEKDAGVDALCIGVLWPLLRHVSSVPSECSLHARLDVLACCLKGMRPISTNRVSQLEVNLASTPASHVEFSTWLPTLVSSIDSGLAEAFSAAEEAEEYVASTRLLRELGLFSLSDRCIKPQYFLSNCLPGAGKWLSRGSRMRSLESVEAVTNATDSLLRLVVHRLVHSSDVLEDVYHVFVSAFDTTSRPLALRTINSWNQSFGLQPDLDYPPQLLRILEIIQRYEQVRLPPSLSRKTSGAAMQNFCQSEDGFIQDHLPWLIASVPIATDETDASTTAMVDRETGLEDFADAETQSIEHDSYAALETAQGTLSGFLESEDRDSQASFVVPAADASFEELSHGILDTDKFAEPADEPNIASSGPIGSPRGGLSTPIPSLVLRPSELNDELPSSPIENLQRDRLILAQRQHPHGAHGISVANEIEIPSSPPEPLESPAMRKKESRLGHFAQDDRQSRIVDSFSAGVRAHTRRLNEDTAKSSERDEDAISIEKSRKFVPIVVIEVQHSSSEASGKPSRPLPDTALSQRVSNTAKRTARGRKRSNTQAPTTDLAVAGDSQHEDSVVILRPYKPDTPSFYETLRDMEASQASASPASRANGKAKVTSDARPPGVSSSKRKSTRTSDDVQHTSKKQRITPVSGKRRSARLSGMENWESVGDAMECDAEPPEVDRLDTSTVSDAPETTETPKRDFSFRSDMTMTEASAASTPSSQGFVEAFTEHFKSLYEDAKKLILGGSRRAEDRRQIEELASDLSKEIQSAGERRKG